MTAASIVMLIVIAVGAAASHRKLPKTTNGGR